MARLGLGKVTGATGGEYQPAARGIALQQGKFIYRVRLGVAGGWVVGLW